MVLKYTLILPFIKKEFKSFDHDSFKFTDSRVINLFTFEMRCLFLIFALDILNDEREYKIICMNTFLGFLRLYNPKLLEFLIVNEYLVIKDYFSISKFIKLHCIFRENSRCKKHFSEVINQRHFEGISKELFDQQYASLDEGKKILILYSYLKNEKFKEEEFCFANINIIEKITSKIRNLFNN